MKLTTIQEAKKLFEYQEDVVCETCKKVTREAWYSFGNWVWNDPNATEQPLYRALSDVIHDAGVDEDSAYRFVVEALDAMFEMMTYNIEVNLQDDYDSIDQYAEAPIYNSELLDWIAKGNQSYIDDALNEYGWNKDSYITQMIGVGYENAWKEVYFAVLKALEKVEEGK